MDAGVRDWGTARIGRERSPLFSSFSRAAEGIARLSKPRRNPKDFEPQPSIKSGFADG
jgi:hypothetical protein